MLFHFILLSTWYGEISSYDVILCSSNSNCKQHMELCTSMLWEQALKNDGTIKENNNINKNWPNLISLVTAPSKFRILRCCPTWMRIFNSESKAIIWSLSVQSGDKHGTWSVLKLSNMGLLFLFKPCVCCFRFHIFYYFFNLHNLKIVK